MIIRGEEIKGEKTEMKCDKQSNFKRKSPYLCHYPSLGSGVTIHFYLCDILFSLTSSSISSTTEGDPLKNSCLFQINKTWTRNVQENEKAQLTSMFFFFQLSKGFLFNNCLVILTCLFIYILLLIFYF